MKAKVPKSGRDLKMNNLQCDVERAQNYKNDREIWMDMMASACDRHDTQKKTHIHSQNDT